MTFDSPVDLNCVAITPISVPVCEILINTFAWSWYINCALGTLIRTHEKFRVRFFYRARDALVKELEMLNISLDTFSKIAVPIETSSLENVVPRYDQ